MPKQAAPLTEALSYDSFGRKEEVQSSTGLTGSYQYDLLNRISQIQWMNKRTADISENLAYDPAGNILSSTREFGDLNYGYDPSNQIESVTAKASSKDKLLDFILDGALDQSFKYDLAGNRTDDNLTANADYLANQITSNKFQKFASDSNGFGELAQESGPFGIGQSYTYRPDGRLASVTGGAATINYSYDALGRRVSKQVTAHQGFFGCSSRNDLVFTQSYSYLIDQDKILLAKAGDGSVNLYIDGDRIDEHLGMVSPQGTAAFETDHMGSVLNTEVAGPLQAYGAFGESLGGLAQLSRSSNPVQYGFAGRQLDSESGNYYDRARMYSPLLGRFTTTDPTGLSGGDVNLYRYGKNEPNNLTDPYGTGPVEAAACRLAVNSQAANYLSQINSQRSTAINNINSQISTAQSQLSRLGSGTCSTDPNINNEISQLNSVISQLQSLALQININYAAGVIAADTASTSAYAACGLLVTAPGP